MSCRADFPLRNTKNWTVKKRERKKNLRIFGVCRHEHEKLFLRETDIGIKVCIMAETVCNCSKNRVLGRE